MPLKQLTSIDLWLNYPPGAVVQTESIKDVACGMYACFYLVCGNHLKVATSVVSLIKESGQFIVNERFQPDFLIFPWPLFTECSWYREGLTVDKRVRRLRPFETVSAKSSGTSLIKRAKIKTKKELIEKVVLCMNAFVREIEERFPEHHHIVLTGGADSQLIHLVSKTQKDKWHVFSSEPNERLVKKWFIKNNLKYNHFFTHDNSNDENKSDLIRKLVNSDCISDPEHMRWLKKCRDIAKRFSNKCIFWTGNCGELHTRKAANVDIPRRVPTHGIYQKTGFQVTGCLFLSAYFSKQMWAEVYSKIDYAMFRGKGDYRQEIGNRLAGRKLFWLKENPGPNPWRLPLETKKDYLCMYIKEIKRALKDNTNIL